MRRRIRKILRLLKIRRQRTFVLDEASEIIDVRPRIDVEIVPITRKNVARATDFREQAVVAEFHEFLDAGQCGVYAIRDSKVIGHAWAIMCKERTCLANGYFRLREGEALIHFCNVHTEYRGKRIYPAMLVELCRRLFTERKARRVIIDAECGNIPSIRAIQKTGFRSVGKVTYFSISKRLILKRRVAD